MGGQVIPRQAGEGLASWLAFKMKKRQKTLALVLAGGAGSRLEPLTLKRSKPVLPFGGSYRLIDIPLSNLHHSQLSQVWLVVQYRPHGLNDHLSNGRPWDLDRTRGGLLVMPPFQGHDTDRNDGFAKGNAQALLLQKEFLQQSDADLVLVLSADHVYRFDYRDLIDFHNSRGADLSVVTWEAPVGHDLTRYSVFETRGDKVANFAYKPDQPRTRTVGCEIFLYSKDVLLDALETLQQEVGDDLGDYGDCLLPRLVSRADVRALQLEGYWRDVGTLESYWQAHQELLQESPPFALEHSDWPLLTDQPFRSPAFFEASARLESSLVSPSCRVAGEIRRSVIGPGCTVAAGAVVEECVLLDGCRIGPDARLRRVIVDAGSEVNQAFGSKEEVTVWADEADEPRDAKKSYRTRRPLEG